MNSKRKIQHSNDKKWHFFNNGPIDLCQLKHFWSRYVSCLHYFSFTQPPSSLSSPLCLLSSTSRDFLYIFFFQSCASSSWSGLDKKRGEKKSKESEISLFFFSPCRFFWVCRPRQPFCPGVGGVASSHQSQSIILHTHPHSDSGQTHEKREENDLFLPSFQRQFTIFQKKSAAIWRRLRPLHRCQSSPRDSDAGTFPNSPNYQQVSPSNIKWFNQPLKNGAKSLLLHFLLLLLHFFRNRISQTDTVCHPRGQKIKTPKSAGNHRVMRRCHFPLPFRSPNRPPHLP